MWIKLHESAKAHPKVVRLSRELGKDVPEALGYACTLWLWVLSISPDGDLSKYGPDDIEYGCGWCGEPGALFAALVGQGLLDNSEDGLTVHDWWDFAGSIIEAKKKRKQRERAKEQTVPGQSPDSPGNVRQERRGEEKRGEEKRGDQFKTAPPPKKDPPTGDHEGICYRLRDHHGKIWKRTPRGQVKLDDHFDRICSAIDEYGEEQCRWIQSGHKKYKNQKNDGDFTAWRHAYPQLKGQASELDFDLCEVYLGLGRPASVVEIENSEVDTDISEEIDRDSARAKELADKAGVARVKSASDLIRIAELAAKEAREGRDV